MAEPSCPNCGSEKGVQWHSLTAWCLRCGWARNWTNSEKQNNIALKDGPKNR